MNNLFNENSREIESPQHAADVKLQSVDNSQPLWQSDNTFLAAVSTYFVAMLLFVCVRVASGLGWFDLLADKVGYSATEAIVTVLIQIVIFLIVPLAIYKFFTKQSFRKTLSSIGFNRPSPRVLGYSFLLGLLFFFFNIFVASLSTMVLALLGYRFPASDTTMVGIGGLLIGLLLVGVLPGVCEEVSNRGILMRGLMSKLGVWRAVLLSSLIFGLMHLNIVQAFFATVLGMFMALAILATRSLWAGIIIHFMNNSINQLISHAQGNGWEIGKIFEQFFDLFSSGIEGLVFYIVFIIFVYICIMRIIHMFARETYKANEKEHFATFLMNNPERVKSMISEGRTVSVEDMARTVDAYTANLSKWRAIQFYLEGQRKPQKLNILELTIVFGIVFLTALVTVMTLVWGLM